MSEKIPTYSMPSPEKMEKRRVALEELWRDFLKLEGEPHLRYHLHKYNVAEVIRRQDQRMHYFRVFHGLDYPCEYKYVAIECFWLITLKPFIVTDENSNFYDAPNEKFALYLILSIIRSVYEIYHPNEEFDYPSDKRIADILYDFKYCSFSREAMIAFVETFADNYNVGIEFILSNKVKIAEVLKNNPILKLFEN